MIQTEAFRKRGFHLCRTGLLRNLAEHLLGLSVDQQHVARLAAVPVFQTKQRRIICRLIVGKLINCIFGFSVNRTRSRSKSQRIVGNCGEDQQKLTYSRV